MQCALYLGNSNLIELMGLKNGATGNYENAASVAVTVKDESDQDLSGETWPKTLNYVAASDGDYRATLDPALVLTHGQIVNVVVTAQAGGLTARWEKPCKAIERT